MVKYEQETSLIITSLLYHLNAKIFLKSAFIVRIQLVNMYFVFTWHQMVFDSTRIKLLNSQQRLQTPLVPAQHHETYAFLPI